MDNPPVVELAWSQSPGAEGCIDRATLGDKVEQIVGRRVFERGHAESVIRGTIGPAPTGAGWLAVVEARSEGATTLRRALAFSGSDCRRLDEAIVLVVALMVDSSERGAPLTVAAPAEPPAVAIGPDFAVAYGMLPGAALGIGLVSEVRVPPLWPVALSTHAWPMSQALSAEGSGGSLGAWTFGGALCPLTLARWAWAVYGCAGVSGGVVYSNGVRLDQPYTSTHPYAQAELRAGLRVRIVGPLFAALELEGAVPFARDSYSYEQADGTPHQVFQTGVVVPLGHARLEVRVP